MSESIPEPGSTVVYYRALGKWQQLQDDGTGQMSGNGTGSISFVTGSLGITCTAMPDTESEIIVAWVPEGGFKYNSLAGQTYTIDKNQQLQTTRITSYNVCYTKLLR